MQPPPLVPSHHWCTYIIVNTSPIGATTTIGAISPLVHIHHSYDTIGASHHWCTCSHHSSNTIHLYLHHHWCTYTHLVTVHHPLVHSSPLVHIRTSLIGAHTHTLVIRLPSLGHPELLVDTDTTLFKGNFVVAFILRLYSPSIETA